MKAPYPEIEQGEKKLSLSEFLIIYNKTLPSGFPLASASYLREFKSAYPKLFNGNNPWSLILHRKKFMDWLPQHLRLLVE